MMRGSFSRRTAIKVKNGKVQRKNNTRPTGTEGWILDRQSPHRGYRHVVSKRDIQNFIEIIPDWPKLSQNLERIVLTNLASDDGQYAFYFREETGAIYLAAWHEDLWVDVDRNYFDAHQRIFDKLGVNYDLREDLVFCHFTDAQARAFTLLHVFIHELGHHHDRVNQKHRGSTRGEDYAEHFANSRFDMLHRAYVNVFGDPTKGD